MSTPEELDQALKALAKAMNNLPSVYVKQLEADSVGREEIIIPSATIIAIAAVAEAVGAILKHLADRERSRSPTL